MDGEIGEADDGTEFNARVASLDFLNATKVSEDTKAGDSESGKMGVRRSVELGLNVRIQGWLS